MKTIWLRSFIVALVFAGAPFWVAAQTYRVTTTARPVTADMTFTFQNLPRDITGPVEVRLISNNLKTGYLEERPVYGWVSRPCGESCCGPRDLLGRCTQWCTQYCDYLEQVGVEYVFVDSYASIRFDDVPASGLGKYNCEPANEALLHNDDVARAAIQDDGVFTVRIIGAFACEGESSLAVQLSYPYTLAPAITSLGTTALLYEQLVLINGDRMTGALGVTFNNKSASFLVLNDAQVVAAVPVGVTSGQVRVYNAYGSSPPVDYTIRSPTSHAGDVTFSQVSATSMHVNFAAGNGQQRMVIVKVGSAPSFVPQDGVHNYSGNAASGEYIIYKGNGNSFEMPGCQPNTEYFFKIFEFNIDGSQKYYLRHNNPPAVSQRTLPQTPLLSSNEPLMVVSPANGAEDVNVILNISARAVSGATSYTIEVSPNADFSGSIVRTGPSRTLPFEMLEYNTAYYTRVKTNLQEDFGPATVFVTRTPESLAYVINPANDAVGMNTSLTVASNTVPYASSYTIQLSEAPDFGTVAFEQTGATRGLAFKNLKYNTRYYSRVRTDLSATFGQVQSFTTGGSEAYSYVTAPVHGSTGVNTSANISSNAVSGASTYTIQLSTTPDFADIAFEVTGSSRTLAFSGLAYGQTYYNRVKTNLSPGFGPVRSFTTRTAESITYLNSPANGSINVNWQTNLSSTSVPGATLYTIEANTSPTFDPSSAIVKSGGSRTIAFSLGYNQTYYVRVRTELSDAWGPARSFTTADPVSRSFITSPAGNSEGVPTAVTVVCNQVQGAGLYTVQLSTVADFGTGVIARTSSSKNISFSGLSEGTQYFARVGTNLVPGAWGTVSSFTTIEPVAVAAGDWIGEEVYEEAVVEEALLETSPEERAFDVEIAGNPFKDVLRIKVVTPKQGQAAVAVRDLNGRVIHDTVVATNQQAEFSMEVAQGVYLLSVQTQYGIRHERVIKTDQ